MSMGLPGPSRVTADAVVGVSGKPTRVFSIELISGSSASTLTMRNGTTTGGTTWAQVDGTANQSVTKNWAGGLLFPSGCFADVDANISYVVISFTTDSTT